MCSLPLGALGGVAAVGHAGGGDEFGNQEVLLRIAQQYCKGWASWDEGPPAERRQEWPSAKPVARAEAFAGPYAAGARLRHRSPAPDPSEEEEFLVDAADELRAQASGVTYRRSKLLEDKADDAEIAQWGTLVKGADRGDGWLRVGERYLPMAVAGGVVLFHTVNGPLGDESDDGNGNEDEWAEDPVDRLFRRAELKVAAAERERQELRQRTRQALQSSATWRRRRGGADVQAAPPMPEPQAGALKAVAGIEVASSAASVATAPAQAAGAAPAPAAEDSALAAAPATAAASPTRPCIWRVVANSHVALRSAPEATAKVLGTLRPGDEVFVDGSPEGPWLLVSGVCGRPKLAEDAWALFDASDHGLGVLLERTGKGVV